MPSIATVATRPLATSLAVYPNPFDRGVFEPAEPSRQVGGHHHPGRNGYIEGFHLAFEGNLGQHIGAFEDRIGNPFLFRAHDQAKPFLHVLLIDSFLSLFGTTDGFDIIGTQHQKAV